jgi:hypothetical protein
MLYNVINQAKHYASIEYFSSPRLHKMLTQHKTMNNPVSTESHSVNQPVLSIPSSNVAQTVNKAITSEKVVPETLTKLMTPTTKNTTRIGRVVHKPQRLIETVS